MQLNAIAYYADFFLAGLAIVALAAIGIQPTLADGDLTGLVVWAVMLPAGLVAWTLAEYWVHRVLYHEVPVFRELHDRHHAEPDAFIGGPPVVMIATIFALAFLPLVFVHVQAAQAFTTGVLTGYMAYMLVHHAVHHWAPEPGSWLYGLRRHHALHHHHSEEGNFGIVTAFWDRIFGTAVMPARRRRSVA